MRVQQLVIRILSICLLFSFSLISKANTLEDAKKEITEIVKHLHKVNGNFSLGGAPKVLINEEKKAGAAYNPILHTLSVDLKLYEICQTFGDQTKDALAFIVGHEMAHCYMEHHIFSKFLNYNKCEGAETNSEKNADLYGLFNAYLGGYKSFNIVSEIISKIYKEYKLKDKLSGYPTKTERMAIAEEVKIEIKELITIYESANHLSAIGRYDLAAASFEYILRFYQGREVYNNLGVNYVLEALNFTGKDHDLLLYPVEIDWNSRIKKPKTGRGKEDLSSAELAYRNHCLEMAIEKFKKSILMDQSYYTADINLICAMTLLGDYNSAIAHYNNVENSKKALMYSIVESKLESAMLAMSLAKSKLSESRSEAINNLEKLSSSSNAQISYIAKYNLRIIEEGECGLAEKFSCEEPVSSSQLIDDIALYNYSAKGKPYELGEGYTVRIDELESSTVFQYFNEGIVVFSYQQIEAKAEVKNTLDISNKTKIVNISDGYFMLCEENKSVYRLNSQNKLLGWAKYY